MPRNAWLTPDSAPTGFVCRRVFIPADAEWIAIVSGALIELIYDFNFEEHGTATPAETAAVFSELFEKWSKEGQACKMVGEIVLWAGSSAPDDAFWLVCDGSHVSSADYPDLWAVIGTTYGGSGATDFALPDLGGRAVIGENGSHALASTGGAEAVTLTGAEMPSHSHIDTGHTHAEGSALPSLGAAIVGVPVPSAVPSPSVTAPGSASLTNSGGGGSHENMQPYLALRYYIVAA